MKNIPSKELKAVKIYIDGLVQGVGFRPFIFRLAKQFNLAGLVENRNDCVRIKIEGSSAAIDDFVSAIKNDPPALARIESVVCKQAEVEGFCDFSISVNNNVTDKVTLVSPDVAVCNACLKDIKTQPDRLYYPFVNCVDCGPRFSLIRLLPYHRANTCMDKFKMCENCQAEYDDPENRRFDAQPNACSICGPQYTLVFNDSLITGSKEITGKTCGLIKAGKIAAIKGVGGFHLVCDARNYDAVKRIRAGKNREGKPFAVLMPNIETAKKYVYINESEEEVLMSRRRPILLLKIKENLAPNICVGLNRLGVMIAYTPLHYMLFEHGEFDALVFTSGNATDSPIIIDNDRAEKELGKIADALLIYNREIYNRCDDSVGVVVNSKIRVIRRSRGFAPDPVNLDFDVEGIIGAGAELKNCFCVGKGNRAILSQHIGDLKNIEIFNLYNESIERFSSLFKVKPKLIARDMHPDYLSTKYANDSGLETIAVQHHHAHIASCMAENEYYSDLIGVCFDGAGFGDDGNIWGGEIFIINDVINYRRYAHLDYLPLPGGDKAAKEPWRIAVSYLYKTFGKGFVEIDLPFLKEVSEGDINMMVSLIDQQINAPLTSSMGRLFDAVSAIINLCLFSTFEAEAPMRLENIVDEKVKERYEYGIDGAIDATGIIKGVVNDMADRVSAPIISTKFHNSVVSIILDASIKARLETGINAVALSGGLFQNSYILEKSENALKQNGFKVYTHSNVPANDGGVALGQLVIAAKKRRSKCV